MRHDGNMTTRSQVLLYCALLLLTLGGCSHKTKPPDSTPTRVLQTENVEDDIYEAVFKDMVHYRPPDRAAPSDHFFLEVEGQGLGSDFLGRFAGMEAHVRPLSASTTTAGGQVVDVETKKPGIRLNAGRITWRNDRTAVVLADYLARPLSGNLGFEYTIELQDGWWVVTSCGLLYAN
jgi:hypothetical protein